MITLNRTFEEIYGFYTKVYYPMESLLRDMIDNYLIRHLDNTNEDEPQEVKITVLSDNASSPEACPIIIKMWLSEDGDVCFQYEDDDMVMDLSSLSAYQLMSVLEGYTTNYEHFCDICSVCSE